MQAKRINVNEQNLGAGGQVDIDLIVPGTPRENANFHNIWFSVSVEPQNAGANCQGTWVLWNRPDGMPTIIFNDATIQGETRNTQLIACGVYSASNESVYNFSSQVKTSRNLGPLERMTLSIVITGITAGLASTRGMLCAHTVRA